MTAKGKWYEDEPTKFDSGEFERAKRILRGGDIAIAMDETTSRIIKLLLGEADSSFEMKIVRGRCVGVKRL